MDGLAATPRGAPLDTAREHYLQRLLERFERGELQAYEYTRRVRQVELAGTTKDMVDIVEAPMPAEPELDAVDMLELARRRTLTPERSRVRLLWPVLLGVFLVVLLGVGLWLAGHAKALHGAGSGTGSTGGVIQPLSSSESSRR